MKSLVLSVCLLSLQAFSFSLPLKADADSLPGYLNEAQRARYEFLIDATMKNRPGTKAAEINFITRQGENTSLYSLDSPQDILLLFYDPDCDECRATIQLLASDDALEEMIQKGALNVLAIYTGDDRALWEETAGMLPESWIVGYDEGEIDETESYIFPGMPTLYLLMPDKTVLLKELQPQTLLSLLKH